MPREAKAAKQARARLVAEALAAAYPRSTCALRHETPFQLLCATVLSAQTTDRAVNQATPGLFRDFPTPAAMAAARDGAVEEHIRGIGLWRNKAKHLRGLSQMLVDDFHGRLPTTVKEMMRLPGVGKKTATAVLGTAMGIAAGITVDTHMLRINRLLDLSRASGPDAMSDDLEALLAPAQWASYTHRVIDHGRLVCVANRPRCGVCPLADLCPSAFDAAAGYDEKYDALEPASAQGLSWLARAARLGDD